MLQQGHNAWILTVVASSCYYWLRTSNIYVHNNSYVASYYGYIHCYPLIKMHIVQLAMDKYGLAQSFTGT